MSGWSNDGVASVDGILLTTQHFQPNWNLNYKVMVRIIQTVGWTDGRTNRQTKLRTKRSYSMKKPTSNYYYNYKTATIQDSLSESKTNPPPTPTTTLIK